MRSADASVFEAWWDDVSDQGDKAAAALVELSTKKIPLASTATNGVHEGDINRNQPPNITKLISSALSLVFQARACAGEGDYQPSATQVHMVLDSALANCRPLSEANMGYAVIVRNF
jgi:hypothetical protein